MILETRSLNKSFGGIVAARDISLSVAENLSNSFEVEVPPGLRKLVEDNKLGKKTGRGFYRYKKGKPVMDKDADMGQQKVIQNRLVFRFLNEAAACIDEGIVEDRDLLDAGIIFGTGFAPFRGGPLNYALEEDIEKLKAAMSDYAASYGSRFEPVKGWSQVEV